MRINPIKRKTAASCISRIIHWIAVVKNLIKWLAANKSIINGFAEIKNLIELIRYFMNLF